jgi:hypothetical protein
MTSRDNLRRTYLVECYEPGLEHAEAQLAADRALAASVELREEGRELEYIGAILVPGDEVVFHMFASEGERDVREASVRASLPYERVVESIAVGRLQLSSKHFEPRPQP